MSLIESLKPLFGAGYQNTCGYPNPSTSDLTTWSTLGKGATPTSIYKVGLFGYDISCLASLCAELSDYAGWCSVMTGLAIDGWSMGVSVFTAIADDGDFTIVQTQENGGDVSLKPALTGEWYNYQFVANYSVVAGTAPPTVITRILSTSLPAPAPVYHYGL